MTDSHRLNHRIVRLGPRAPPAPPDTPGPPRAVTEFGTAAYRPGGDPRDDLDLDLAGAGIVRVLDGPRGETRSGLPWEPRAAFTALADSYRA